MPAINTASPITPGARCRIARRKRSSVRFGQSRSNYISASALLLVDLGLQVILQSHLSQKLDLRFKPVDMLFGIVQNVLEQVARNKITNRYEQGNRLFNGF